MTLLLLLLLPQLGKKRASNARLGRLPRFSGMSDEAYGDGHSAVYRGHFFASAIVVAGGGDTLLFRVYVGCTWARHQLV